MARTFPTVGSSVQDVYMTGATRPGTYVYVTTLGNSTRQSYVGGVMYAEDATTKASGSTYGYRYRMSTSGTKTGGDFHALGVRLSVGGINPAAHNALSIYTTVGAYATTSLRGIYMYMDTCTTVPPIVYGIDLGIVGTGLSTVGSFQRMYNHGTDAMYSVFTFDNAAQDIATNLFVFGAANQLPLSASNTGEAVVQKAACLIGGQTRYLHFHSQ